MNYKRIYDMLVAKRRKHVLIKDQNFPGTIESHHIVPLCMNGSDDKDNLVNFLAREHYIAHLLLAKAYQNTEFGASLFQAVRMMRVCSPTQYGNRESYRFNSRLYQKIREIGQKLRRKQWDEMPEEKKNKIKAKISACHADVSGKNNPMYGHSVKEFMSEEKIKLWKQHLSDKHRGKGNSAYGKKWIFNVKTDEKKYLLEQDAIKFIENHKDWKFGLPKHMRVKMTSHLFGRKDSEMTIAKRVLNTFITNNPKIDFAGFDRKTYFSTENREERRLKIRDFIEKFQDR